MSVTLKTNCPKCNADQLKAHMTCGDTTVVLKFKCATCGHVFSAHLVEASAWRQDTWFCTIAGQLWSADYKLATRRNERGSFEYDQGAGQRLLYRWQGVQMLLAPENGHYLGTYLGVPVVLVRPESMLHEHDDQKWEKLKEEIGVKLSRNL